MYNRRRTLKKRELGNNGEKSGRKCQIQKEAQLAALDTITWMKLQAVDVSPVHPTVSSQCPDPTEMQGFLRQSRAKLRRSDFR